MCGVGKEASIVEERPEGRVPPPIGVAIVYKSSGIYVPHPTAPSAGISGIGDDEHSKR